MITYVNTVLVSNKNNAQWATANDLKGKQNKADLANLVGKFVFMNCDPAKQDGTPIQDIYAFDADCDTFRLGVIKDSFFSKFDKQSGKVLYTPNVKWSNEIKVADIKSLTKLTYQADTEDVVTIDLSDTKVDVEDRDLLAAGGIPVVLRLTFKDMPTRYRKWSESYDYVTKPGDTTADVVAGLAQTINRQSRRARVWAEANGKVLTLTAMEYTDDDSNDSENFYAKVRFNANIWYSNPQAPGFASTNKYAIGEISKVNGVTYPASGKNVRDRERTAQGYEGIMHRCCRLTDRFPAIVTDINNKYNGMTLEFENMYRAADDIFRKTKQTVELYASNNGNAADIDFIVDAISSMIDDRQKIVNPIDNATYAKP